MKSIHGGKLETLSKSIIGKIVHPSSINTMKSLICKSTKNHSFPLIIMSALSTIVFPCAKTF